MTRELVLGFVLGVLVTFSGLWLKDYINNPFIAPVNEDEGAVERQFDKYSFTSLREREFAASEILIKDTVKSNPSFSTHSFEFVADPLDSAKRKGKKVSGIINIPKAKGEYPVIVMFRGYIDQKLYNPGDGTRRAAEAFARAGFITLAPDFLGYGSSEKQAEHALESRFQTYTTALTLLSSLENLNKTLPDGITVDLSQVGIWGHSNGGQIAITVLETSGVDYPTVLWAPVTKPFPYSILYYTDEAEDKGRFLRRLIADFEVDYNVAEYSLERHLDWIRSPIQLHQGSADDAVPQRWSDEFVTALEELDKDVQYFVYERDDHNFARGSWETVVNRNIKFYKERLQ